MTSLEGMVCPWVGCGGTLTRISTKEGREPRDGWICNSCGEFFASTAEYESKLRTENEWARAWIEWNQADRSEEAPLQARVQAAQAAGELGSEAD